MKNFIRKMGPTSKLAAFWMTTLSPLVFAYAAAPMAKITAVAAWYFSTRNPTLSGFLTVARNVLGSFAYAILSPFLGWLGGVLLGEGWAAFVAAASILPGLLGWWVWPLVAALVGAF